MNAHHDGSQTCTFLPHIGVDFCRYKELKGATKKPLGYFPL